jgi:VCBS repeat-containing protein
MKTTYIRGFSPLHIEQLAAAATLVFAGIFILFLALPATALAVADPPVVDPLSFTVEEGATYDGTLTATYDGLGTLSFNVVQAPHQGSLLLYADGTFSYDADTQDQNQSFMASDSFTIRVTADELDSVPLTVPITITPLPDVTPPELYSVEVYNHYGEVSGERADISVSLRDYRSLVAEMCLWIGDGPTNLLPGTACKDISERDWNSYDYAPSFPYRFDTRLVPDGTYSLHIFARDGAGNTSTTTANVTVTVNNESLGSRVDPVIITSCTELQAINDNPGWYYELVNDIDCSDTRNWHGGDGLEQLVIGTELKGNNHTISHVYMDTDYTGVMHVDSNALVDGVNLRDVDLTCHSSYCGGFSRYNYGTINQSSITGTLNCGGTCGGFASQQSGIISESWAGLTINGSSRASGFAGHSSNGKVINSYFRGYLATGDGGGIVGLNDGWNDVGMVDTSYAANTFSDNTYQPGGLIGWQYKGDQARSYWDAELSGLDVMCGQGGTNCQNDHGLTTAEMKTQASFVDWDFADVWAIDPAKNDGYPYLQWQTSFYEADTSDDEDDEGDEEEPPVVEDPEPRRSSGGSTATRVGERQSSQTTSGQVLGATTSAEEEATLAQQREIVRLLQQLISLLTQLHTNR